MFFRALYVYDKLTNLNVRLLMMICQFSKIVYIMLYTLRSFIINTLPECYSLQETFYNSSYLDKANAFKRGPSLNFFEKSPKHYHRPGISSLFKLFCSIFFAFWVDACLIRTVHKRPMMQKIMSVYPTSKP